MPLNGEYEPSRNDRTGGSGRTPIRNSPPTEPVPAVRSRCSSSNPSRRRHFTSLCPEQRPKFWQGTFSGNAGLSPRQAIGHAHDRRQDHIDV
jgi:hypothetical protein